MKNKKKDYFIVKCQQERKKKNPFRITVERIDPFRLRLRRHAARGAEHNSDVSTRLADDDAWRARAPSSPVG